MNDVVFYCTQFMHITKKGLAAFSQATKPHFHNQTSLIFIKTGKSKNVASKNKKNVKKFKFYFYDLSNVQGEYFQRCLPTRYKTDITIVWEGIPVKVLFVSRKWLMI